MKSMERRLSPDEAREFEKSQVVERIITEHGDDVKNQLNTLTGDKNESVVVRALEKAGNRNESREIIMKMAQLMTGESEGISPEDKAELEELLLLGVAASEAVDIRVSGEEEPIH